MQVDPPEQGIDDLDTMFQLCDTKVSTGMVSVATKELNLETRNTVFRADMVLNSHESSRERRSALLRPIDLLPDELVARLFSYLDVRSLMTARHVATRLNNVGTRDASGWPRHCEVLWRGKIHVWSGAYQLKAEGKSMSAYFASCQDAALRQDITENELCYDPISQSGTIWSFRMKRAAGPSWTDADPWHHGREARKLVFLRDGRIAQLVGGSDGSTQLLSPFSDNDFARHPNFQQIEMNWRYILHPLDEPRRPPGAYIRIKFMGKDIPTYVVQRAPKPLNNWGFIMDSCWGLFSSFPLPKRRPSIGLPRRTYYYTVDTAYLNVRGLLSDSNPEEETRDSIVERLLADESLPTSDTRQWREALLYNLGSATLPEGERAVAEFDRMFHPLHSISNTVQY